MKLSFRNLINTRTIPTATAAFGLTIILLCYCHPACAQNSYQVSGSRILKNGVPTEWRGVDAMHTFGGDSGDMKT